MKFRNLTFVAAIAVVLSLVEAQAFAQAVTAKPAKPAATSGTWSVPRTVDGQPDLQGVWANNNAAPLERPKELAGRAFLTEQEVAALKRKAGELFEGQSDAAFGDQVFVSVLANVNGSKSGFKSTDGETGDYSSVWTVERQWDNRTSLITDPADGRLPAMTPRAADIQKTAAAKRFGQPAGPEDRSLSERCISFGAPRMQAGYNSYFQIQQSPSNVAILMETIHDVRVVPLDGRPHVPAGVQSWLGDPRGRWEGDTLVIDTTNYRPGAFMNVSTEKLHIVERYTRTGPDSMKWEITVDDPGAWARPWTAMIPLQRSQDALYEYSCQEGNYGLKGILEGARAEEKSK